MDIEHVRSRFIKHFDGTTGAVTLLRDASTSLVSIQTITVVLYSLEQSIKV